MSATLPNTPPPARRSTGDCEMASNEMIPYNEMERFNIENLNFNTPLIDRVSQSICDKQVRFIHCWSVQGVRFILELKQFSYTTSDSLAIEPIPKAEIGAVPAILQGAINCTPNYFVGVMLITADKIWILRHKEVTIVGQCYRITSGSTSNLQRDHLPYVIISQDLLNHDTIRELHKIDGIICRKVFNDSYQKITEMKEKIRAVEKMFEKYRSYRKDILDGWKFLFDNTPEEIIDFVSVNEEKEQIIKLQQDLSHYESAITDLHVRIKHLIQHIL